MSQSTSDSAVQQVSAQAVQAGEPQEPLTPEQAEAEILAHQEKEPYRPRNKVRFVTASSLFDGHDASINIMRRILQSSGAEVIHLGHNRSVEEVVNAAIQEDVQGIAVSSYQGGHMEYFKYMYDLLQERGAGHIKIFGGGGGVIVPEEIAELEAYGITKIFSPDDGRRLGLQGMINFMLRACDVPTVRTVRDELAQLRKDNWAAIARLITLVEQPDDADDAYGDVVAAVRERAGAVPVLGITGTGGAGKSSLTDELVRRFLEDFEDKTVAIFSVDPSKQRTGGALLGDRIRMNALNNPRAYMRSLATRQSRSELSSAIREAIDIAKAAGFDLIIVETSGIGQGDAGIVDIADVSLYVMTAEYGAPSQLEKIEMLDYADVVAINKFDRRGSEDARRYVAKQLQRNRGAFDHDVESMPVYGTVASQFNDPGTNVLYRALIDVINQKCGTKWETRIEAGDPNERKPAIIPGERAQYLLEIVNTVRDYRKFTAQQVALARKCWQLRGVIAQLQEAGAGDTSEGAAGASGAHGEDLAASLQAMYDRLWQQLHFEARQILEGWDAKKARYQAEEFVTKVRDREIRTPLYTVSLSGLRVPKVCLPQYEDWGEILRWSMLENVPGEFPFTAGVFPLKRADEDPKRQFAGEGTPARTNRRFHYLSKNDRAKRLSTAFDSVTLYGEDPDYRPDIYGKVGESGVSVCTLDDMKKLYAGFDLCDPLTSVSMTINGPAPILLAMFMNTAIDQQIDKFTAEHGRAPSDEERAQIRARTLQTVRGTVQADILKEDQGQNTCIFSTEFALRMMGDIQQYFIDHKVRNYYSVSISGYHIAEAGANPISQLAFTLANAFTYVEYYLSRGMHVDDFAPNLSFFFSNGMDPEYTVIGRVARRIWATVMKHKYGANERSQKLKYHIQTSGRSLHAQEVDFNDIRTTLQALLAIYDNCNSLHTNAYDEAITTPTEESVRRAMAIQMIINREFGLTKNENPLQGAFIVEELTDLVEEAVLQEFLRINDRGGVLGAMETQYQRSKIQEESMYYEHLKHSGELPIIGVNTFLNPKTLAPDYTPPKLELARATKEEKEEQIRNLRAFHEAHKDEAPAALARLKQVARQGGNLFAELMETVRVASLGQITQALYEVGGKYRRNM
ncbi:cobalamin-dependent protein [Alicyclobacillus cycloheptanicus]|uniref:Fused isobutyryl-CoA mutase n=1 Tax=Alicyclobacillus cycloheptanicus TaxID=1457 RepID=A0ABT9XF48_9BACL|nr:fused isobutyryl-CoA mutase/GTPase IcmF [Alicyclobacillus cycloheptanicus]MDQ0188919.1 methylmalonyl-CoA mutase [Alicyclobacillus cycloheptanicus]WDM01732.1 cobalamin-dependent protein [Alicyclobacillus cycloheptanicus]